LKVYEQLLKSQDQAVLEHIHKALLRLRQC
jgi:hypothetical protein